MVAIEAETAIVRLGPEALDDCLTLSDEAGWNQNEADWSYFLRQGIVFGQRTHDGTLVATAALLPYPPITWISMVLVTKAWRRRGLANALMRRCIDEATARGLTPWLDATPAGATVYGPMGFVATGASFTRLRRPSRESFHAIDATPNASASLFAADRLVMGVDRKPLLRSFIDRAGSTLYETPDAVCLVRDGRRARQIGLLFATAPDDAVTMLDRCLNAEAAELVIDVADGQPTVSAFLQARGFAVERPFVRMCYGGTPIHADRERLVAIAGPEFG